MPTFAPNLCPHPRTAPQLPPSNWTQRRCEVRRASYMRQSPTCTCFVTPDSDELSMLNRFPRHIPTFAELLKDSLLLRLTNRAIGKAFGVSERTVRRWKCTEAPVSIRVAFVGLYMRGPGGSTLRTRQAWAARWPRDGAARHRAGGWMGARSKRSGAGQRTRYDDRGDPRTGPCGA